MQSIRPFYVRKFRCTPRLAPPQAGLRHCVSRKVFFCGVHAAAKNDLTLFAPLRRRELCETKKSCDALHHSSFSFYFFLPPWVAFMRFSWLRMVLRMRRFLRRDLQQLVVGEELEALLQAQLARRDQAQRLVGAGGAHVGHLLLLADVDGDVLAAWGTTPTTMPS